MEPCARQQRRSRSNWSPSAACGRRAPPSQPGRHRGCRPRRGRSRRRPTARATWRVPRPRCARWSRRARPRPTGRRSGWCGSGSPAPERWRDQCGRRDGNADEAATRNHATKPSLWRRSALSALRCIRFHHSGGNPTSQLFHVISAQKADGSAGRSQSCNRLQPAYAPARERRHPAPTHPGAHLTDQRQGRCAPRRRVDRDRVAGDQLSGPGRRVDAADGPRCDRQAGLRATRRRARAAQPPQQDGRRRRAVVRVRAVRAHDELDAASARSQRLRDGAGRAPLRPQGRAARDRSVDRPRRRRVRVRRAASRPRVVRARSRTTADPTF